MIAVRKPSTALRDPAWLRFALLAIALAFVAVFLVLPLVAVFVYALEKGVDLLPLKKNIAPLPDVDPIVAEMVSWLGKGYGVGTQIGIHWREATNSLVQEAQAVLSGQKQAKQALDDVAATVGPVLDGQ